MEHNTNNIRGKKGLSPATLYLMSKLTRDMVFRLSSFHPNNDRANDRLVRSFIHDVRVNGGNEDLSKLMEIVRKYWILTSMQDTGQSCNNNEVPLSCTDNTIIRKQRPCRGVR